METLTLSSPLLVASFALPHCRLQNLFMSSPSPQRGCPAAWLYFVH